MPDDKLLMRDEVYGINAAENEVYKIKPATNPATGYVLIEHIATFDNYMDSTAYCKAKNGANDA